MWQASRIGNEDEDEDGNEIERRQIIFFLQYHETLSKLYKVSLPSSETRPRIKQRKLGSLIPKHKGKEVEDRNSPISLVVS